MIFLGIVIVLSHVEISLAQIETSTPTASSTEEQTRNIAEQSLKVGLVLSGGGARGFAHIGALKVLEEVGMPIDYIAGTSMGSIVGGLYAIGYSAAEIEQLITEVDWGDLFSDTPPRNLWSYQKKQATSKYILGVGFTRNGFVVPKGFTAGQKISNFLSFLTLRASDIEHFDDLPIPYRAVAADIGTGEEVVLDHGSLADAMRASMAVPGVFTPVDMNGHLLVDGGIVKNLPVDIVKAMGADVVIAIDVSSPLKSSEELGNPLSILNQMIALQMLKATEEQRELADLLVITDLEDYSSTNFGKGAEIVALGEASVRAKVEEFQQLADKVNATRPTDRSIIDRVKQQAQAFIVQDIVIEGNTLGDEEILLKQLDEQIGRPLQPNLLEQKIEEIFSTGKYETVKFSLLPSGEREKILKLQLQEREQATHFLRFGMNYEARMDDAEEDKMVLLLSASLNNLTSPGASWTTDFQFVNVLKVQSEYIQPVGKGFFLAPHVYLSQDFQSIYENKDFVARYDADDVGFGMRIGTFLRRFGEISIGGVFEYIDVAPTAQALEEQYPKFQETVSALIVRSHLDLLDNYPFPTSGRTVTMEYQMASQQLGGEVDYHRFALDYQQYMSFKQRNTIGLRLQAGTDFKSSMRRYKHFYFGGRDSFVGYKIDEFSGVHLGVASLEYRYRFYQLPSAVGGGIFATAIANVGNVWESFQEMTDDFTVRYGGSVGIGVDTVLGPVNADFAMGNGGRQTIYVNIGYKF
jgi:NTE family protein